MNIANDQLAEFIGTSRWHEYFSGNVLTDGVLALAERFKCHWYLQIICSYSDQLREYEFQQWTLTKFADSSALIECTDGNRVVLISQKVLFTDFSVDKAIIWKEGDVLLLPSEH